MTNQDIRDMISDMGYPDAIVFDSPSYDEAIIGVSDDGRVIYDYEMMIQCLIDEDRMSELDAAEFIDYNSIRAASYLPNGPIVMYGIKI